MKLHYRGRVYDADSAAEIVEAMQKDCGENSTGKRSLKSFIGNSLSRMEHTIPRRELEVSIDLPDEEVAFNYLCLLESYDGGRLIT